MGDFTDYSFSKQDRLLRRSQFLHVARRGRRYFTQFFIVHLYPNNKNRPRLGITVSKKIGNAVERNYFKRRIREFFRLHKYQLPRSTDILVVARKGITTRELTYAMVCKDLMPLLVKETRAFPNRHGDRPG